MRLILGVLMISSFAACSDDGPPAGSDAGGDGGPSDGGGSDGGGSDAGQRDSGATDAGTTDAGTTDAGTTDAGSAGPTVHIHIRATADAFPHADGFAGQTPLDHKNGIRRFEIRRSANDPNPVTVFDHGQGFVEAGYNGGDDTIVGSSLAADLAAGRFLVGKVVVTHVRYAVAATMHYQGLSLAGRFDNVQVLSKDVELDGKKRDRGFYHFEFSAFGQTFPIEGTDASTIPSSPSGAPIVSRVEDGETVLEFPVDLLVDPAVQTDVHYVIEFNVDRSFRWEDQNLAGYMPDVFDATPVSFEPIKRFGANSYRVFPE